MERIKRLFQQFEAFNAQFKEVSYEDTVIEDEEAARLYSERLLVEQEKSTQNAIREVPQEATVDDEEDDDESDDEDFDVNKKLDDDECSSDEDSNAGDFDLNNKDEESKSGLVQIDTSKEIWESFLKDVEEIEARRIEEAAKSSEQLKTRVRRYEFAGETFTVQESYSFREKELLKSFEKLERVQKNVFKHPNRLQPPKRRIELPDVLSQLKKCKLSTLTKTKHDWDEYKKDKDIVEELSQHQKSKQSFVERQAFLGRTDMRAYEKEKKMREHSRKIRQQKQYDDVPLT